MSTFKCSVMCILLLAIGCGREAPEDKKPPTTRDEDMSNTSLDMDTSGADMAKGDLGALADASMEDLADQPVMEDMRSPADMRAGEEMGDGAEVLLKGSVSKGPFVLGSSVTVAVLDESGDPTGETFLTQTTNDLGEFSVKIPAETPVLIEGSGFWFNEIVGELSGANFTMRGYLAPSSASEQAAYVNIVTHMSSGRVRTLLASGASYPDAIEQAQEELIAELKVGPSDLVVGAGTSIDPLNGSVEAAYALALGALAFHAAYTRQGSIESEFQQLLNQVQLDLADNGKLDAQAQTVPDELDAMHAWVDVHLTTAFLRQRVLETVPQRDLESEPLPDLDLIIDSDGDGVVNAQDVCVMTPNPDQADNNGDGVGNVCNFEFDRGVVIPSSTRVKDGYPNNMICAATGRIGTSHPRTMCWRYADGVFSPNHRLPPENSVITRPGEVDRALNQIDANDSQVCGRGAGQGLHCWFSSTGTIQTIDEKVFDFHMNKDAMCWVNAPMVDPTYGLTVGTVTCGTASGMNRRVLTGAFHAPLVRDEHFCGLTGEKKLRCKIIATDEEFGYHGSVMEDPLFDEIITARSQEPGNMIVCGLRAAEDTRPGEISCYEVRRLSQSLTLTDFSRDVMPGVQFKKIAYGSRVCGIESQSNEIKCEGVDDVKTGELHIPRGEFTDLAMGDDILCGLKHHRLHCHKLIQPLVHQPR